MNVTVYTPADIRFRAKLAFEEAQRERVEREARDENLRREALVNTLRRNVRAVLDLNLDDLGWEWCDSLPRTTVDGLTFGLPVDPDFDDELTILNLEHPCGHTMDTLPVADLAVLGALLQTAQDKCWACQHWEAVSGQ